MEVSFGLEGTGVLIDLGSCDCVVSPAALGVAGLEVFAAELGVVEMFVFSSSPCPAVTSVDD